jgi:hypothetical protein
VAGPPILKPKDLAAIKALLKDGDLTIREVTERLGISVASLYGIGSTMIRKPGLRLGL